MVFCVGSAFLLISFGLPFVKWLQTPRRRGALTPEWLMKGRRMNVGME